MATFHSVSNEILNTAAGELAASIVGTASGFAQDIAAKFGLQEPAAQAVLAKAWVEVAEQALLRATEIRSCRAGDDERDGDSV
jgi:hypothetical protein